MTDELTPERVRAALAFLERKRRDFPETTEYADIAAIAHAWLANAAAPPASPWRRITPEVLARMHDSSLFVRGECGSKAFAWFDPICLYWRQDAGEQEALTFTPVEYIPLDEPPTEAGR